jgi:hypothetical protein
MFPTACVFLWIVGLATAAHRLSTNTGCSFQHLSHSRQNHGGVTVCSRRRNVPVHPMGSTFPHIFGTILRYSSPGMNSDSTKEKKIASSAEKNKSYVSMIRSCNLAGVVAATNEEGDMEEQGTCRSNDITLRFQRGSLSGSNLIAVTGETGSGKSLLVSRVADLVTGGKAASSLLQISQSKDGTNGHNESLMMERPPATVEMGKWQPAARRNTRALSLQSCVSNLW